MGHGRIPVSFVLPGRGRSGGVRVTVEMASRLRGRGFDVRILHRRSPTRGTARWRRIVADVATVLAHRESADWLAEFDGSAESFARLEDVSFREGEIVIAVGSLVVNECYHLMAPVFKVRYCHGIPDDDEQLLHTAWRLPMTTITVASTLVEPLRRLTGEQHIPVIPNGINTSQYYPTRGERNAVGAVYHDATAKCPEYIRETMRRLAAEAPHLPRVAFGIGRRPADLNVGVYRRLPSVSEAREIYNRCKVWFLTSRREGFSLPILEAMACGCAVVSSDNVGSRAIVTHGENGLLVPIGDTASMVAGIRRVVADDVLRARLVEAGAETVRHYSWDRAADRMEAYLIRVAHDATPRAISVGVTSERTLKPGQAC